MSIVHGDYRLENVIVSPDAEIEAVLDWEMATLGDPLADLGLLYVYWDAVPALGTNPIAEAIDPSLGFLSADELVARYSIVTGHRPEDLSWYVGLGAFKLAVVLESIHYRYELGLTVGDRYDEIGALVAPLAEYGLATLEKA